MSLGMKPIPKPFKLLKRFGFNEFKFINAFVSKQEAKKHCINTKMEGEFTIVQYVERFCVSVDKVKASKIELH